MSDRIAAAAKLVPSASLTVEEVLSVRHWNEHLFSFKISRPPSFRFRSGEFVMIGLPGGEGRPLLRAYSIASPAYADELEFLSIKVPGTEGVLLTFDDFVQGVEAFGERIQPLMKSRAHVQSPVPSQVEPERLAA